MWMNPILISPDSPLANYAAVVDFLQKKQIESVCRDRRSWRFVIRMVSSETGKTWQKEYVAWWRDQAPTVPWTMNVWDVYEVQGEGRTRGLGWFWCWPEVIQVIQTELLRYWVEPFKAHKM